MDVIINRDNRTELYFRAWKTYDTELLEQIFTPTAKYIIRHKYVYCGIDQIIAYWNKNKLRQKGLHLHWREIDSGARGTKVEFGAYFMDVNEQMYTKVNGQIIFVYTLDNRISKLTEAYSKRCIPKGATTKKMYVARNKILQ